MINNSLLYCTIICISFVFLSYKKIGLKNKTYILPSTIFALIWGITSFGGYLYSNQLIGESDYYYYAEHLDEIGKYQMMILLTAICAFYLVRIKYKSQQISIPFYFGNVEIPILYKKLRWVLYTFFIIGIFRLAIVVSSVGFDYAIIRSSYVEGRTAYNSIDLNFIRLGSYLLQFSQLYICLLGIDSATNGIRLKKVIIDFLLFCPFQLSFGGRLFILSFFMPYIISYLLTFTSMRNLSINKKQEIRKFTKLIFIPVFLIIFFQILKMGVSLDLQSLSEFSTEIFYTSSSYRHINEFLIGIPNDYNHELGKNIMGFSSDIYKEIKESWIETRNSAIVCIPSMIPQMYLDFGKIGSLPIYFMIFYNMEKYAFVSLRETSLKGFLVFILLCLLAYQTAASSVSDLLKSFIVGYIAIKLLLITTPKNI